jgi:hypothetical protein
LPGPSLSRIGGGGGRPIRALPHALERRAKRVAADLAGRRLRARFAEVRRFCLFVGHPRSGHSLVGAMLNAHRNAVVCHELDALSRVREGCSRDALYWWILRRDRRFTAGGSVGSGYDYAIPGQWQGRFESLHVVGDKRAGAAVRAFAAEPSLLSRLRALVGVPLRFVQVVRNPWDNVATIARRERRTLEDAADYYFWLWDEAERLHAGLDDGELAWVRHEEMVADPAVRLAALCGFLDLSVDREYLAACAGRVWPEAAASRHRTSWPDGLRERIAERSARHARLAGYRFEG